MDFHNTTVGYLHVEQGVLGHKLLLSDHGPGKQWAIETRVTFEDSDEMEHIVCDQEETIDASDQAIPTR